MLEVSVVVCTLNRAASLQRALDSLCVQTAPSDRFEVLVVDNGSTDETPKVVAELAARCPSVRGVHEPRTGLSHARNRGIEEARGEVVAFLDDDATADPGWVESLAGAFADPRVGAAGGKVVLEFPDRRPAWLPPRLEGFYSGLDLGDEPMTFPDRLGPYGANMAVRRSTLATTGGFSPALGRRGRNLISNEEVELFERVRRSGALIRYEPAAWVRHHIEPERVSRRYLLRRAYAQGRSRAIAQDQHDPARGSARWLRMAGGTAWAALRDGPLAMVRALRVADRQVELMSEACRTATRCGFVAQAARLAVLRRPVGAAASGSQPPRPDASTAQAFEAIYRDATWVTSADQNGYSGTGSTLTSTVTYRAFLQQFLAEHQIRSVVDAGCGDWEFSQTIDWSGIDYKGYDIVASVIDGNHRHTRPNIQFFVGNIVEDELPAADLLISKHVLQHLPDAAVKEFLRRLPQYRHVLLINGVNAVTLSASHKTPIVPGGYRPLDVTRPPFDVPGKKVLTYWDGHHMHQVVHVDNRSPS